MDGITSSITGSIGLRQEKRSLGSHKRVLRQRSLWSRRGLAAIVIYTKGLANYARIYKEIFWGLTFRNNINIRDYHVSVGSFAALSTNSSCSGELTVCGVSVGLPWVNRRRPHAARQIRRQIQRPCRFNNSHIDAFWRSARSFITRLKFEFNLVTEAQIKGVIFYDVGEADDAIELGQMRQDVGFGFRWFSPIGPLRFEWGFPLDRHPATKTLVTLNLVLDHRFNFRGEIYGQIFNRNDFCSFAHFVGQFGLMPPRTTTTLK